MSLFETLDAIRAETASIPVPWNGETIVARACHLEFFVTVLCEYMNGERTSRPEWETSWEHRAATRAEWQSILQTIRERYVRARQLFESLSDSDDGDFVSGTTQIVAHTMFHLGAIRQIAGYLESKSKQAACS